MISSIWGSGAGDVYLVCPGQGAYPGSPQPPIPSTILHSSDRGRTWVAEESSTTESWWCVWGSSATDVYATDAPKIWHSAGDGTWTAGTSPALWLWGSGPADLHATSNARPSPDPLSWSFYRSTGGGAGATWIAEPVNVSWFIWGFYRVWGTGPHDIYATAMNTIAHTTGDGTWSVQQVLGPDPHYLYDVWGSGPGDVYVVGDAVLHSSDSGKTWQPLSVTTQRIEAIWGSGKDDIYLVGDYGTVVHYH